MTNFLKSENPKIQKEINFLIIGNRYQNQIMVRMAKRAIALEIMQTNGGFRGITGLNKQAAIMRLAATRDAALIVNKIVAYKTK